MREIGSEFWDVLTSENENSLFPKSTQWFLSGRSALQAIVTELTGIRSVAIPSWCCDSMIKPFANAGLKVVFYPVYFDGEVVQKVSTECDALFIIDYFGYTGNQPNLKNYKGKIIRDVTHSIFSKVYSDADYYFGSLRKWCGVWTGGYAWTSDGHALLNGHEENTEYVYLRKQAMQLKKNYISRSGVVDKAYLHLFDKAETCLDDVGIAPAAERDIQLIQWLDVETIKQTRKTNAEILRKAFSQWLIFPTNNMTDCPMFVPVLVPEGRRNELRKFLIDHQIYCPIHWPTSCFHTLDEKTEYLYKNELSLVCDQRYTANDMYRMIEVITSFWKEVC